MTRRAWIAAGLAATAVVGVAIAVVLDQVAGPGVVVAVRNGGAKAVRAVEVTTTAGVYALGDLAPGAATEVSVGARGESEAMVAWTDAGGTRRATCAVGYFEGTADGRTYSRIRSEVVIDGSEAQVDDRPADVSALSSSGATARPPDRPAPDRR